MPCNSFHGGVTGLAVLIVWAMLLNLALASL